MEIVLTGTRHPAKIFTTTSAECLTEGMQSSSTMRTRPNSKKFLLEKHVDIMAGGVKERVLAYNSESDSSTTIMTGKRASRVLTGHTFAREVYVTTCSPVWKHIRTAAPGGSGMTM